MKDKTDYESCNKCGFQNSKHVEIKICPNTASGSVIGEDKTDYESALVKAATDHHFMGSVSAFKTGAKWSRRYSYTEDKVIAELLDAVNRYIALPSKMLYNELIDARHKFQEEKKKWSGEK